MFSYRYVKIRKFIEKQNNSSLFIRDFDSYAAQVTLIFLTGSFSFMPVSSLCLAMSQNDKDLNLAFLHRNSSPFIL